MKISDTAVDLAVAVAIMSSFKKRSVSGGVCFFGELGLTGEVRQGTLSELRIKEALRLNFKKVYTNIRIPHSAEAVVSYNLIQDFMKLF